MATASEAAKTREEAEIERLGFKYKLDPEFDLGRLSPDRRVQTRHAHVLEAKADYAPHQAINQYAVQMAHTIFPPIIATKDGWLVDGNTRVGAYLVRKVPSALAYVIDLEWGKATQRQKDDLFALGLTMNGTSGTPLTRSERRKGVRHMLALKWSNASIERALGISPNTVASVRKEISAEDRLNEVGVKPNGKVELGTLRELGAQSATGLHDKQYKELANLSIAAGLKPLEAKELVTKVQKAPSDKDADQVLADFRDESGDRIKTLELTGVSIPPEARFLRQHLGAINKYKDNVEPVVERNPQVIERHREAIAQAIQTLEKVRDAQDAWHRQFELDLEATG